MLVSHHLPPERPVGPKGGRPRIGHRVVLKVIWFVLVTGCRREDVPHEMGCSGRTAHRRLRAWEEPPGRRPSGMCLRRRVAPSNPGNAK
jgi:transposase